MGKILGGGKNVFFFTEKKKNREENEEHVWGRKIAYWQKNNEE